jgi:hypothetical protein
MEPATGIVIVGLILLLAGKKRRAPPTPPTPGPLGPSDPLPDGTKTDPTTGEKWGHLPKGSDQSWLDGMRDNELRISPDCQGFVVGEKWVPTFDGMTAAQWMEANLAAWDTLDAEMDAVDQGSGWPLIVDFGRTFQMRFPGHTPTWTHHTYVEMGLYPGHLPMVTRFILGVIGEVSESCADTLPSGAGIPLAEWQRRFEQWRAEYPGLDFLCGLLVLASRGQMYEVIYDNRPEIRPTVS